MIRERIKKDLIKAVKDALGSPVADEIKDVHLEHPANPEHGDYASNLALTKFEEVQNSKFKIQNYSSKLKAETPQELAELIVSHFPEVDYLEKAEVAGPGFINFFLKKEWLQSQVGEILRQKGEYGIDEKFKIQNSKSKIQVEFISANPTGPLHAGNARGGFCGDVLANVLAKVGYRVQREYYINDKGVQVEKLGESVKAYYQHLQGQSLEIPEGGYAGEYVREIAKKMLAEGRTDFKEFALSEIMKMIKKTIVRMGIKFDNFFSEQSLYSTFQVEKTLRLLEERGLTYKKEGAVWIKTTQFGDDKDRVLVKSDGSMTYLVSDIAYHLDKFERRKFDKVILFWGADHHGYVPRFMAVMEALGHGGKAQVELIQLLKLARGGKVVRMSKRAGEYVTVDDILDEIGLDAARFHFLAVPLDTPMTLDLKKAKEQSEKNPVYYAQYAHARLSSILRKCQMSNVKCQSHMSNLKTKEELVLIRKLIQLPEIVVDIAQNHEVHRLPQYSLELADAFHKFYENCRVLSDDEELTVARLGLVRATKIILSEVLSLMGISAPERM